MSVENVIALLGESRYSPRISERENRNSRPLQDKGLRQFGESGDSRSLPYTCAGARARARAREEERGTGDSPESGDSHAAPSLAVTILKHCRCIDCRHWIRAPYSMCRHGVIVNGVGAALEYPPDAWHYCALYHGPQASPDVWAWPHGVEGVVGPSGDSDGCDRGGNGSLPGLFRSTARAQTAGQPNEEA
jgi:hypothetical protein